MQLYNKNTATIGSIGYKLKAKSSAGFTLIEILIALSIGAVIATIITVVTTAGLTNIRNIRRAERLQTNSIFIVDTLGYWIKQGIVLDTPTASMLDITIPTATSTATVVFKKNGDRVTLDDAAITSDDVKVTYLSFTTYSRSVRMGFTLQSASGGETLSATTTLARRNSF